MWRCSTRRRRRQLPTKKAFIPLTWYCLVRFRFFKLFLPLFGQECSAHLTTPDIWEWETSRHLNGLSTALGVSRADAGELRNHQINHDCGGASCTQRLLGTRTGENSHLEREHKKNKAAQFTDMPLSPQRPHSKPCHLQTLLTTSCGEPSRPPSLFPRPTKPRLSLALPPQLWLGTCSQHAMAEDFPKKQGLTHHGRVGGPGPGSVVHGSLPSPLPSLLTADLCQDQTMLPQVPPDLQRPTS